MRRSQRSPIGCCPRRKRFHSGVECYAHIRFWKIVHAGVSSASAGPIASSASRATERHTLRSSAQELAPRVVQPDTRLHADEDSRARGLVRIGEDGIARENDAALDAYFAKNFVCHGPGGDMTYAQLKATFASMRAAFSDFAVTRPVIIVKGDMIAARTTMTGIFTGPFSAPPYGTLAPTGKPIKGSRHESRVSVRFE